MQKGSRTNTEWLEQLQSEQTARAGARKSLTEYCQFTLPAYQVAPHHRMISYYLERLSWKRESNNIMFWAPPRHGKSELAAIRWPSWHLGAAPQDHFICTAYGDELARTFSRACRNVTQLPNYQALWPHKLKNDSDNKWQLHRKEDDERATYIAAGILSALTGEGANWLVVDDPVKNAEEAYSKKIRDKTWDNFITAANTRLAAGGKKVLIMTRWHEDDLAGRLIKRALEDKKADQWTVVCLAAINDHGTDSFIWDTRSGRKDYLKPYQALWPERFPREELNRIKATLGEVFWSALYMQRPQAAEGGVFKRSNWRYYDSLPQLQGLVQVYDTAHAEGQENDFSAGIDLGYGTQGYPVLDAWRDKVNFPKLVAKVYERWNACQERYHRYPDRVLIENKGSGISLLQQIATNNQTGLWIFPDGTAKPVPKLPIVPMPAVVSKFVRAQGIVGYHEAGLVTLPRGAPWHDDFVDEHSLFDKGPHDDWVDTLVHGLTWVAHGVKTDLQEIGKIFNQLGNEEGTIIDSVTEFDRRMADYNW